MKRQLRDHKITSRLAGLLLVLILLLMVAPLTAASVAPLPQDEPETVITKETALPAEKETETAAPGETTLDPNDAPGKETEEAAEPGEESKEEEAEPGEESAEEEEAEPGEESEEEETAEPGEESEEQEAASGEGLEEQEQKPAPPPHSVTVPDSISGFFWVDGNGDLDTDWDGLYNGDELPLQGYTVNLYAADDLTKSIAETRTDSDGKYIFAELQPGSYILGIRGGSVDGIDYLPPVFITEENKFAIDWSISGLPAYTEAIELKQGRAIKDINAGLRLPMGVAVRADYTSLRYMVDLKKNDSIRIDNYKWFVVTTKTITVDSKSVKAIYLINQGVESTQSFGNSVEYETSNIRTRMNNYFTTNRFPTINAMAIVPNIGTDHWSTTFETVPKEPAEMAKIGSQDVFFAPSLRDMEVWAGANYGQQIPVGVPMNKNYANGMPTRFFFRTARTVAELYGYLRSANMIEGGIHYNGYDQIWISPGVWVNAAAVNRDVNVYYVDTAGNELRAPYTESVRLDLAFTFPLSSILPIDGYEYIEWRKGFNGATQSISVAPNLDVNEVVAGKDIYLVHKSSGTDIKVTKTVTGEFGVDKDQSFTFTAYFKDSNGNKLPAGKTFNTQIIIPELPEPINYTLTLGQNGEASFNLNDEWVITIFSVPADALISIVEEPETYYIATFIDSENANGDIEANNMQPRPVGAGDINNTRTFDFENYRMPPPFTGVDTESKPMQALFYLMTLAMLAVFAASEYIRRKICAN